jgi:hypothetical protein
MKVGAARLVVGQNYGDTLFERYRRITERYGNNGTEVTVHRYTRGTGDYGGTHTPDWSLSTVHEQQ